MLRSLIVALLALSPGFAAIWPDQLGAHHKASAAPLALDTNRPVWDEYGFEEAERADYGAFKVTAYRFKDTTGAYAAGQWLKPTDSNVSPVGNYVLTCTGRCPQTQQLTDLFAAAAPPKLSRAAFPILDGWLPAKNLVPGSKRYVLGPVSLAQFEPRIPVSAVSFDFGTEGQLARYKTDKGEQTVAIFSYPTPEIARHQSKAFEDIPESATKRTGPLVVLVLPPSTRPTAFTDRAAADTLLAQINYSASISIDDPPPLVMKPETAAHMLMSIFTLSGIVLAFCVASGLLFAGYRLLARRFGYSDANEGMTWLHLSDK